MSAFGMLAAPGLGVLTIAAIGGRVPALGRELRAIAFVVLGVGARPAR
ncbi:hypothetical protein [Amycolatopsis decaplanina]|nr:hypothetical protein [Amycolatopsis decaplanina]